MKRLIGYSAPMQSAFRAVPLITSRTAATAAGSANVPPARAIQHTNPAYAPTGRAREHTSTSSRAPMTAYTTRGTLPTSTLDDAARAAALADLDVDSVTTGTAVARSSAVNTWEYFHVRWFGHATPSLPLTTEKIRAVAAQMKAAGYRSYPNFLSAIKNDHLDGGHQWTQELDRCHGRCKASTQRGIGPPRQALELSPSDLHGLQLDAEPLYPGGPISPYHWAVICTFHVLRGGEAACAVATSLTVDHDRLRETFCLPASKTDPSAIGCQRSWGCTCAPAGAPTRPCPYHSAIAIRRELVRRFGSVGGVLPPGLPLFPNSQGEWCTRQGFVGTINAMATLLRVDTIDSMGRDTVGEHVWRVSGARHLAGIGIPQAMIMLLARWGSQIVLRYISDAPLRRLTDAYLQCIDPDAADEPPTTCPPLQDIDKESLPYGTDEAVALAATLIEEAQDLEENPSLPAGKYAFNADTGFVHIVAQRRAWDRQIHGRSNCGWDYKAQRAVTSNTLPLGVRCGKCARAATWAKLEHEALADESCSE